MDKLQWFKFTPTDWIMGKIQRCPEITQSRFLRLVCLYWNKECVLSFDDAEIEIDKEHLQILIDKKIVKVNENQINIQFLDEQYLEILETSKKRSDAVKQRWLRVKQNNTSVLQVDTSVLQSDTDKIREEEKREEEKRKENNTATPFSALNFLFDLGVEITLANEWLKVRKSKKLTNTETAFRNLKKEFDKCGKPVNEIITKCVNESWGGFKASWDWKEEPQKEVKQKYRLSCAMGSSDYWLTESEVVEKTKSGFYTAVKLS